MCPHIMLYNIIIKCSLKVPNVPHIMLYNIVIKCSLKVPNVPSYNVI